MEQDVPVGARAMEPKRRFDPGDLAEPEDTRSPGALFRTLGADAATLVREEPRCAEVEVREAARPGRRSKSCRAPGS